MHLYVWSDHTGEGNLQHQVAYIPVGKDRREGGGGVGMCEKWEGGVG